MLFANSFRLADRSGRTNKPAEMTADTLSTYQTRTAGLTVEDNSLMATIATRYLTTSAANAQIFVEPRIDNSLAIQKVGL